MLYFKRAGAFAPLKITLLSEKDTVDMSFKDTMATGKNDMKTVIWPAFKRNPVGPVLFLAGAAGMGSFMTDPFTIHFAVSLLLLIVGYVIWNATVKKTKAVYEADRRGW